MARGTTCRPLSAVVSNYDFSSEENIGVPAQAGFGATDLVIFGLPRDIGWAEAGRKYWSFSDISVTLAANYNVSELGSGYGGRLSLKISLEALLTPQQQTSIAPIVTKAH